MSDEAAVSASVSASTESTEAPATETAAPVSPAALRAAAMAIGGDPAATETDTDESTAEAETASADEATVTVESLRELAKSDPIKLLEALGIKGAPADWRAYRAKVAKMTARERMVDQREGEFKAQTAAWQEQNNAKLQGYEKAFAALKEDPLAFLDSHGIKLDDLTVRAIKAGTPEETAAKLQARIDKLEAERAEERKAQAAQSTEAQRRATEDAFISLAVSAEHPALAKFADIHGRARTLEEALHVIPELQKSLGRVPTDGEIATRLNRGAAAYFAKIQGTGTPLVAAPAGQGATGTPNKPGKPKTIGSALSSERSGAAATTLKTPKERRQAAMNIE